MSFLRIEEPLRPPRIVFPGRQRVSGGAGPRHGYRECVRAVIADHECLGPIRRRFRRVFRCFSPKIDVRGACACLSRPTGAAGEGFLVERRVTARHGILSLRHFLPPVQEKVRRLGPRYVLLRKARHIHGYRGSSQPSCTPYIDGRSVLALVVAVFPRSGRRQLSQEKVDAVRALHRLVRPLKAACGSRRSAGHARSPCHCSSCLLALFRRGSPLRLSQKESGRPTSAARTCKAPGIRPRLPWLLVAFLHSVNIRQERAGPRRSPVSWQRAAAAFPRES